MTISLATVLSFTDREIEDLRIEMLNPPSPEMPNGPLMGLRESFLLGASIPGFVPTAIALGMVERDATRAGRLHALRGEVAALEGADRFVDDLGKAGAARAIGRRRQREIGAS